MQGFSSPEVMSSLALVPEHLADYVRAVSGLRPRFCRGWPVYLNGETAVLVGYSSDYVDYAQGVENGTGGAAKVPDTSAANGVPAAGAENPTARGSAFASPGRSGAAAPGQTLSTALAADEDVPPSEAPGKALGKFLDEPLDGPPGEPLNESPDESRAEVLDEALAEVAAWDGVRRLTTLAPFRPVGAPEATHQPLEPDDWYFALDLPFFDKNGRAGKQKLRNMLHRGARELTLTREETPGLPADCLALVEATLAARQLGPGLRHIYSRLGDYLEEAPGAVLFTARYRDPESLLSTAGGRNSESADPAACLKKDGELHGFCIGDFSALDTAFYMFAFRRPDAVPGTADLLLATLVAEAERLGYRRVNLGLGVNSGIGFFKQKWGARRFLPYFETSWAVAPPAPEKRGLLRRLFG